jgi:hypothetical protein
VTSDDGHHRSAAALLKVRRPFAAGPDDSSRPRLRALELVFLAIVLLQRFAIPVEPSYVSPILVVVLMFCIYALRSRMITVDRHRFGAFGCAAAAVLMSTALVSAGGGTISMTSVGLLCVAYAPYVFRLRDQLAESYERFLDFVGTTLYALAIVATAQILLQLFGLWTYTDILAAVVPEQFLVQGYVTSYPIYYGSDIFKPNAIVLLEPSFCSQFVALGILLELRRRRRVLRLAVLACALVATFSGTGLILLAVGLGVMIFERGRRFALMSVAVSIPLVVLVALTPIGDVYAARASGQTAVTSSGNQRFVAPYLRYWESTQGPAVDLLVGQGPGSTQEQAERLNVLAAVPAIEPAHTKLLVEYGLIGGGIFLAFLLYSFIVGTRSRLLTVAVLFMFFVLGASLLQIQVIYLPWVLVILFAHPRRRDRGAEPSEGRRQVR